MDARPDVVSAEDWQLARNELMVAEKEATRTLDAIAARRRRLPMMRFDTNYRFETPDGPMSLLDFFDERDQLVVYQFMDVGPDAFCPGCTNFTNNVAALDVLGRCGASWRTVSNMPLAQLESHSKEMGWNIPIASSRDTSFADDCGADGGFMLSVFLADNGEVFRTYNTTSRGVDRLLFVNNVLDLLPFGRQEDWEDSPPGWPQHPTYG